MKMFKTMWLFLALLFIFTTPAFSQTRVFVDGEVGAGSLGFKAPHLSLGVSVEHTVSRFTSISSFSVSPDIKQFAQAGHSFSFGETIETRLFQRLALRTGVEYNIYWSEIPIGSTCPVGNVGPDGPDGQQCITSYSPYHKGGFNPFVGVAIKDSWFGDPGKLTVDYLIKTGDIHLEKLIPTECVFASAGNNCPITSPQETGIIAAQSFELWPRFSIGLRGGWINYGDQVNPFAPQLGQTRHNTGFTEATLRYQIFGPKQ